VAVRILSEEWAIESSAGETTMYYTMAIAVVTTRAVWQGVSISRGRKQNRFAWRFGLLFQVGSLPSYV
jgi:hypothetical protein